MTRQHEQAARQSGAPPGAPPGPSLNDLDLASIDPSRGAKYSPNLFKWLTAPRRRREDFSRVYRDGNGTLWIGFLADGDFIGSMLMEVLCTGRKAESRCWLSLGRLSEVEDFWARYVTDGRCAIDEAHRLHFIGDDSRWHQVDEDHRTCLWCGKATLALRRWTEQVERQKWVLAPQADDPALGGQ